ncbi:DUF3299 domain-containing protein [Uliginosibacterium aquaticum]|uniref:DUF3299 domain-containing protein n=1 Tax=Uliginosibacterium aquaticum TaxID=2731212 RepID=A0ABX2IJC7_9RHOO|nr:DUF3299 domain-containing protein [Uliginosibacterium aquaticum]NSL54160.1 DUF3299 domain-containing protein [Uliginosibacterium aquaticum]
MKLKRPLCLMSSLMVLLLAACGPQQTDAPAYKLGERLAPAAVKAASSYRELFWEDLTPKGWDPLAGIRQEDIARLQDGDPQANQLMQKMREAWDKAPAVPALDRQSVRIAGFLVPLDAERENIREFLLVPYFGACIHSPPPPSNQTIHVVMDKPFRGRMMEPFWISGELRIEHIDSPFGVASYRLSGQRAERYVAPAKS